MSFDRSEFLRSQEKMLTERRDDREIHKLRQIRQGSVLAENITGSEPWNQFLSLVQGEIESLRELRDVERNRALSANPMESWKRDGYRVEALRLDTAIDTLTRVLELPKALHEDASSADDILKRRDGD